MEIGLVARRMAASILKREGRLTLYYTGEGRRKIAGGRNFVVGSEPPGCIFVIEWPFRPSPTSCEDMVREHRYTGAKVVYNEARWERDPRIEKQAGASLTEGWGLEDFLDGAQPKVLEAEPPMERMAA